MEKKKFILLNKILSICIGAIILFGGIAVMIRCDVGLSPLDSINQVFSDLFAISVGDVNFIASIVFFIALLIFKNKRMILRDYFVLVYIVISSWLLNLFLYDIFGNLVIEGYLLQLIIYIIMIPVTAFGVVLIVKTKLITPPLEGLCLAISENAKISFGMIRWIADGILILVVIGTTLIFNLHWYIGIGTIAALILYGPLLDFFQKPADKFLKLLHIDF